MDALQPESKIVSTTNLSLLERSLHYKQLQLKRILDITQAINTNVSAQGLYKIYSDVIGWEMGVRRSTLLLNTGDQWEFVVSTGISGLKVDKDLVGELEGLKRSTNLTNAKHPILQEFDIVIPVSHKNKAIAFSLIGDFNDNDDIYEKVSFITTVTNIVAVAIENKRLFKRQIEQERLQRELELAAKVQSMLIPNKLPKTDRYELDGIYLPFHGVGGDYYDFFELENQAIACCIADISGKGISAALLMSNFQATLQAMINQEQDANYFIETLNKAVLRTTRGDRFITFFIGKYYLEEKKLRYINAGHTSPFLYREGEILELDKGCTILGAFDKIPHIEVGEVDLPNGGLLFTYTDGLTDMKNNNDEYFGEEMIRDFLNKNAALNPQAFNGELLNEIMLFKEDQVFPDDITFLTCLLK